MLPHPLMDCTVLVAQTSASRDPTRLLIVIGVLIVTVVAFGLIVLQLRKWLLNKDGNRDSPASLMEDIRAMHKRGEISDAEYQNMRQRLVQKLSVASAQGLSNRSDEGGDPMRVSGVKPAARRVSQTGNAGRLPTSENRAKPKFDLTGDRLPDPAPEGTEPGSSDDDQEGRGPTR